jgi:pimeloyl-ACP methyl ester carboxylesterase
VKTVLLHALPLDGRSWDGVAALLEGDVLYPTLYGLGDTVVEWAHAVLRLAGHEPLLLVGHSVGGSCAIEMALLAPGQLRHMVLVGANGTCQPLWGS